MVSDCGAIDFIVSQHHWRNYTYAQASAAALLAGCDLDCGDVYSRADGGLADALAQVIAACLFGRSVSTGLLLDCHPVTAGCHPIAIWSPLDCHMMATDPTDAHRDSSPRTISRRRSVACWPRASRWASSTTRRSRRTLPPSTRWQVKLITDDE